jgi:hypothetical protein
MKNSNLAERFDEFAEVVRGLDSPGPKSPRTLAAVADAEKRARPRPVPARRRIQIREVIKAHLDKERELYAQGVKVLSLFFIDEVAKYRDYSREDTLGIYARVFEEEYAAQKAELLSQLDLVCRGIIRGVFNKRGLAAAFLDLVNNAGRCCYKV